MSSTTTQWHIEGRFFESCNCEILCPCMLSAGQAIPTEIHCDVIMAIEIKAGSYGKVDISGLNAVQALVTPGAMAKGNGTMAVYVDKRANPEQHAALEAIFTGQAGGPPALMNGIIATRLPTVTTGIDFSSDGKVWKLSIPGISEVTVEGITGAEGKVVWLENVVHPFTNYLAAGRGVSSHYSDHSLVFENSGRNGHYAPISWTVS
jgi:hypothetical protein